MVSGIHHKHNYQEDHNGQPTGEELLYFNGVNGATGAYGLPPMTGEELSKFVRGGASPRNLDETPL